MPIDQVGDLLVRWRGAGGVFGRGRVLRESIQLLAGLDGDERRLLARSLAEQGVPDLAARIESRSGGAMSADQLWSVADGLLAMDDHQVRQLAASLRDPAERERMARQAVTYGIAPFDEEPSPPEVASPGLGSPELGSPELSSPELGWQDLQTTDLLEPGLVDVGLGDVGLAEFGSDMEDMEDVEDVASSALANDTEGPAEQPASTDEDDDPPDAPDAPDTPDAPQVPRRQREGADVTTLLRAVTDAPTASSRLRLLGPDELAGLDGQSALAVLDALPDGWQRRRAAIRLVDAGAFPTGDLDAALGRFGRSTDAVFVAGALLAAGQVRPERLDGMLPERAVRRLTARTER